MNFLGLGNLATKSKKSTAKGKKSSSNGTGSGRVRVRVPIPRIEEQPGESRAIIAPPAFPGHVTAPTIFAPTACVAFGRLIYASVRPTSGSVTPTSAYTSVRRISSTRSAYLHLTSASARSNSGSLQPTSVCARPTCATPSGVYLGASNSARDSSLFRRT
ncbi:hypothetical protein PtA15_8A321 [Puccinia triticina]|uniref:Uncharacterized protein n=1 Tax=Puccinia triticina TaxID=208348 RepID=A0ABY7CXH2_9BASI|nr:uncharacterized protein PtA15_8A321 [Puccinia triticina]WAQ87417.1 hypothetical protein PtA15_8A321 [Puccinia triticina]WAR57270.1 hypothetical protein PtB15_8B317 [Puccinia triticina]